MTYPLASGWSARGGNNIGAYYAKQGPVGSSSGSGVAPSVGLAPIAIGGVYIRYAGVFQADITM